MRPITISSLVLTVVSTGAASVALQRAQAGMLGDDLDAEKIDGRLHAVPLVAAQQEITAMRICARGVRDQAAPPTCLDASSVPVLGSLYPITEDLFVDVDGSVGLGTTEPEATLDVRGAMRRPTSGDATILYGGDEEVGADTAFDSWRLRYVGSFFGASEDALIIEKTDINAFDPDGGIAFTNTGQDGLVEVALAIRGDGSVDVPGTLTKGAGSFRIDHPLDPENKYLAHSFVESPDMMNVYNGNVVLGEDGSAVVELPEWFESLNRDFRYQLTSIGQFAPVYIAEGIQENQFKIAGGAPGLEVSWQVTGVRQDPFAEANRIIVEEDKPAAERGSLLHPPAREQGATPTGR